MRKINYFIVFALVLMMPLVASAMMEQKGVHEAGTGLEQPELKEANQGTGQALDMEDEDVEVGYENMEVKPVLYAGNGEGNKGEVKQAGQADQATHEPGTGLENPELKEQMQEQAKAGLLGVNTDTPEPQMQLQVQNKNGEGLGNSLNVSEKALQRRSQVANAVQKMLQVADKHSGVGEQIREVAQNQNQVMEKAEEALQKAKDRGRFTRFLIGPNYRKLDDVETQLEMHNEKLEELKDLRDDVMSSVDRETLDNQIELMEEVAKELKNEVESEVEGFSLFGWLNRLFVK